MEEALALVVALAGRLGEVRKLSLEVRHAWPWEGPSVAEQRRLYTALGAALPHMHTLRVPTTPCLKGLEGLQHRAQLVEVRVETLLRTLVDSEGFDSFLLFEEVRSLLAVPSLRRLHLELGGTDSRATIRLEAEARRVPADADDAATLAGLQAMQRMQLLGLRQLLYLAPEALPHLETLTCALGMGGGAGASSLDWAELGFRCGVLHRLHVVTAVGSGALNYLAAAAAPCLLEEPLRLEELRLKKWTAAAADIAERPRGAAPEPAAGGQPHEDAVRAQLR